MEQNCGCLWIQKYLFLSSPCVRSSSPWPGSTSCEFADLILADGCTALLPVLWVHQHWLRRHCAVLWSTAAWTCHTSAQTGKQTCHAFAWSLALTSLFSFPCVPFLSVYFSSSFSSFPLPCSPFGELECKLKFFFGVFIYLITLICTKGESHKTELHRHRMLLLFQCREATPACVHSETAVQIKLEASSEWGQAVFVKFFDQISSVAKEGANFLDICFLLPFSSS